MSSVTFLCRWLDTGDNVVDAMSWGNTFAFNPGLTASVLDGQSYARIDSTTDTDTAAARSTPGAVPEPASIAVMGLAATAGLRRRRR